MRIKREYLQYGECIRSSRTIRGMKREAGLKRSGFRESRDLDLVVARVAADATAVKT